MAYRYDGFIPQNVAPSDAKKIGVYDANGKRKFGIMLGGLGHGIGDWLYRFGLISDTHIQPSSSPEYSVKLDNALSWFEEQDTQFVCHTGDITNRGFRNSAGVDTTDQFEEYKRICDLHPYLPVYALCGNHESYYNAVSNYLDDLETYTGNGLYYSFEYSGDVFAFIGQPSAPVAMNEEEITWLEGLLASSKDKRCFVFIHPYISDDSGDTLDISYNAFLTPSMTLTQRLKAALTAHGRAVLFHGHSHFKPDLQEVDDTTNYTQKNGFPSVHVSSLSNPRDVANGEMVSTTGSYGYLVDVFSNFIVIRGRDFIANKWLPIATFKITT